jgi:hypothetical protein
MIKNLRIYACSHGKMGSTNDKSETWLDEKSFGWFMSNKLNLNFINKSQAGASNFHIFKNIYDDLDYITNQDLVLVQWTYVDRAYCCTEFDTIMPQRSGKIARVYYKNLYDDLQEINTVFGYNSLLELLIPNFYFNFSNGSNMLQYYSPKTFQVLSSKKNYLAINKDQLSNKFSSHLIDGFHLTEKGQELLSEKYIDRLLHLKYNS